MSDIYNVKEPWYTIRFVLWLLFRYIPGGVVMLTGIALASIGDFWVGDREASR